MQEEPKKVMRLEEAPPSEIVDVIWYGEKKGTWPANVCHFIDIFLTFWGCSSSCFVSVCSQEMWRADGYVQTDGKLVHMTHIQQYRAGESDRGRARTRGGAKTRAKALGL